MSTAKDSRVIFFRGTSKSSYHFFNIFSERVVKQPSTCPRGYFWKICFFFGKKFIFRKSFDFGQKSFGLFEKGVSRVIKTVFNVSRWSLRREISRKYISGFQYIDSLAKKLNFRWKRFHSLSQLFITCTRQRFEEKYVFRVNRVIFFFGVLVKSFPRGSAEYHSTCSHPLFELLIIFS